MNKKILLDIIMTGLLIILMKLSFLTLNLHELFGITLFILFIVHKWFNYQTIKSLYKNYSKNKPLVKFGFILDHLILLNFIILLISSVFISKNIFSFFNLKQTTLMIDLHHFSAYLIFLMIGIHLGLHLNNILVIIKTKLKLKKKKTNSKFGLFVYIIVAILSLKIIINENFYYHLLKPFGYKKKEIIKEPDSKQESISFEEYIKDKHCSGCAKNCLLTKPQCGVGESYLRQEKINYDRKYTVNKNNVNYNFNLTIKDYILVMYFISGTTYYLIKVKKTSNK